jgi:hypothetical protein
MFSPKCLTKKLAFFVQTTASFCKTLIITLAFEKNAIFSPKIGEIRRKSKHRHLIEPIFDIWAIFSIEQFVLNLG